MTGTATLLAAPEPVRVAMHNLGQELAVARLDARGRRACARRRAPWPQSLSLGCGDLPKEGWLNIDVGRREDISLDLRRPLPFPDGAFSLVHCEHVLEHFDHPGDAFGLLTEIWRVMRPGGILHVGVPDAGAAMRAYANGTLSELFGSYWLYPDWAVTPCEQINYQFRQEGEHLFAYDFPTLRGHLTAAGFTDARKREWRADLDAASRREDGEYTLYVEATRGSHTPKPAASRMPLRHLRRRRWKPGHKGRAVEAAPLLRPEEIDTVRSKLPAGSQLPPFDDVEALQSWLVGLSADHPEVHDFLTQRLNLFSRAWRESLRERGAARGDRSCE